MTDYEKELVERITELEDKVEALRISRRVLMNLIDTIETEYRSKTSVLEQELETERKKIVNWQDKIWTSIYD